MLILIFIRDLVLLYFSFSLLIIDEVLISMIYNIKLLIVGNIINTNTIHLESLKQVSFFVIISLIFIFF